MVFSQQQRDAIRLILGNKDNGSVSELLDALAAMPDSTEGPVQESTTEHYPPLPSSRTESVKDESFSAILPGDYTEHWAALREATDSMPPVASTAAQRPVLGVPATQIQTNTKQQKASRLIPPANDKFVPYAEKLAENGDNYTAWARYSELVLKGRKLVTIIEGTADPLDPEYDDADNRAMVQLTGNVDLKIINQIKASNAFDFWNMLQIRFQHTSKASRSNAHTLLCSKSIGDNETLSDHFKELRRLKAHYENTGGELDMDDWHGIITSSLMGSTKWDSCTVYSDAISNPEALMKTLLLVETRRNRSSTVLASSASTALNASVNSRRSNNSPRKKRTACTNCGNTRHAFEQCWAPGGGAEGQAPSNWEIPIHMKNRVAQSAKTTDANPNKQTESASIVRTEFALSTGALSSEQSKTWILDSGATSHMTHDRRSFTRYEPINPITVNQAGVGNKLEAIGHGTIIVSFIYNGKLTRVSLENVLHVPSLATNLLSGSKITQSGCSIIMLANKSVIYKDKVPFAYAQMSEGHYKTRMTIHYPETAHIVTAATENTAPLSIWHQRLMHASVNRIRSMSSNSAVLGLQISKDDFTCKCEACILGKQTGVPSPARQLEERATENFQVIHTDIEYMIDKSFGGAIYSLKFIDEKSGYLWAFPLKEKTGEAVLAKFKEIDALIETQFNTRVKSIQSDNGKEFVNGGMTQYLTDRGIIHRLTAPHRHQMNGIAERINRTGSNAVRTILIDTGLPRTYWAEAYNHFAYCHNRTGAAFLQPSSTPFEEVFGRKPDISFLRSFGCKAYVRTVPEFRKKLDNKSQVGIFVGINSDSAFRIMLDGQVVISKDVLFDKENANLPCRSVNDHTESSDPEPSDPEPVTWNLRQTPARIARQVQESANAIQTRKQVDGILIPKSWSEAMTTPNKDEWTKAGSYEIGKLESMAVWTVVPRPVNTHVIGGMWVFNIKTDPTGAHEFRARWVARGDSQIPGVEFEDTFAASGDFDVVKIILALAAGQQNATLSTFDINSAYLHSDLKETNIFVEFPTGFTPPGGTNLVCHLHKALYGLRQGARAWQDHFSSKLLTKGFKQLNSAPSVFYRSTVEGETIMETYVDD